jgi:hypothetical protein
MKQSANRWGAAALAAVAASLAFGGVANAASATAFEPKTIVAALTDAGYKAKLGRDEEDNTPFIESAAGGTDIRLAFAGCEKGENCNQVEFIAIWTCKDEVKVCTDAALKWNDDENFSHAMITGDSVATYYHLLFDRAGISPSLFVANFEMFAADMDGFVDVVIKSRGK